ncbi:hypothetical protein ACFTAO_40180 [Paenibacillus rhizoplanae]
MGGRSEKRNDVTIAVVSRFFYYFFTLAVKIRTQRRTLRFSTFIPFSPLFKRSAQRDHSRGGRVSPKASGAGGRAEARLHVSGDGLVFHTQQLQGKAEKRTANSRLGVPPKRKLQDKAKKRGLVFHQSGNCKAKRKVWLGVPPKRKLQDKAKKRGLVFHQSGNCKAKRKSVAWCSTKAQKAPPLLKSCTNCNILRYKWGLDGNCCSKGIIPSKFGGYLGELLHLVQQFNKVRYGYGLEVAISATSRLAEFV